MEGLAARHQDVSTLRCTYSPVDIAMQSQYQK